MSNAVWMGLVAYLFLIIAYYQFAGYLVYVRTGAPTLFEKNPFLRSMAAGPPQEEATVERATELPVDWRVWLLRSFLLLVFMTGILALVAFWGGRWLKVLLPAVSAFYLNELLIGAFPAASPRARWLLGGIAIGAFVASFLTRHWMVNNLLGLAGGLGVLRLLRHVPIRGLAFFSALVLGYDAFHVFGSGMMRQAAEEAQYTPSVLYIPAADLTPLFALGMGDIIIPGLVVLAGMRLAQTNDRPSIRTGAFVGNIVGQVVMLVALGLFDHPQPALIYLLPCTWLGILIGARAGGPLRGLRLQKWPPTTPSVVIPRRRPGPARRAKKPHRQRKRWH